MKSTLGLLRSAIANRSPVSYAPSRTSGFWRSSSGADRSAQLDSMESAGVLFAITSSLAETVAQVDWKLYRKETDNRQSYSYEGVNTRREVLDHQALRVWNKPNPFMTRQEFVETIDLHFELTGEQWWLNSSLPGLSFPTELWPVRPDRMEAVPSARDFLSGYVYTGPEGEKVPLGVEEVIFVRRPHPKDPYRGISPVASIASDIDSDQLASEYNRNWFRNSAQPSGIIRVPKRISDREFNDLRRQWNDSHRGVGNAHRVAILAGEGFEWSNATVTQKDMQFVELRGVSNEMIRVAYRYPKFMLGTVDDVNRANAEASEYTFNKGLIVSRLERIKQALNNDFLPRFGSTGEGVEFDYCSPVSQDRPADNEELTTKVNAYKTLVDAGADPEEALKFLGLPAGMHLVQAPRGPAAPAAPADPIPAARLNGFHRVPVGG